MSKSEALYNSWINDPKYGFFWHSHITHNYCKEEIENMTTIQLKYFIKKINAYKKSLLYTNNTSINELFLDGWKYVNKTLDELEQNYYYHILNTNHQFKNTNHTIVNVPDCYIYDNSERTTFRKIYIGAELMVTKDYKKKCKKNIKELITLCDDINLKSLLTIKTQNQEIFNNLTKTEREKIYAAKRLINDPEKEQKKKELGLLRLKEWMAEDPEGYAKSKAKYNKKKQDLTACETDEELAFKLTRNAIAKALKKLDNANRYKLKQELKLGLVE